MSFHHALYQLFAHRAINRDKPLLEYVAHGLHREHGGAFLKEHESNDTNEEPNSALQMVFKTNRANDANMS